MAEKKAKILVVGQWSDTNFAQGSKVKGQPEGWVFDHNGQPGIAMYSIEEDPDQCRIAGYTLAELREIYDNYVQATRLN